MVKRSKRELELCLGALVEILWAGAERGGKREAEVSVDVEAQ